MRFITTKGKEGEMGTSEAKTDEEQELEDLKRLVDIAFLSIIPFIILYFIFGYFSNAITIYTIAFDYGLSLIVQVFAFQSIRTIQKSNILKFPYGTGKLENFSSFLYGALAIPTSLFIIYTAAWRFMSPPEFISFSLAQIPLVPSLLRSIWLFRRSSKLMQKSESPMVHSYYINFKVTTLFDIGVLIGISFGFVLVSSGQETLAYLLDPIISLILALYMLYCGITLTVGNFKVLIDFPLPEQDQLKIMGVLAQQYESYENIGNIYTRSSGKKRFIEIELYLKKDMSLKEISKLQGKIEKHLQEHFPEMRFILIPMKYKKSRGKKD
ncbi:MAG: cation diffusion facilitator family transporter [Thermoplasmata archaeon]|nr:MAG: cation diffusion facilitator family transporter [Thermoplasmata archaeon]